ncbi:MAG: 2-C-methyl-D-erythritol 4-phosphate cytidylyltransferase [Candidatus Azobacteroides sp.]|nr:2-C-methyl-D-erythritol 4-phosphate cytidylyltransferase [Candidatus Azobacteroides sp.]
MKKYILLVAGGKGVRMGNEVPKQFLPLGGKPVLMHTLERFHKYDTEATLILILPGEQQEYWKSLCVQHSFAIPHVIATGGEARFHSVKNGLDTIPADETGLVAVHDGVRPFVATEVIRNCFEKAILYKAVIPVIGVNETVRYVTGEDNRTVNRDHYKLVQTPQVFDLQLIKRAYQQEYCSDFTDDASVVEKLGEKIYLVAGNRENIKITTPFDLLAGETILSSGCL